MSRRVLEGPALTGNDFHQGLITVHPPHNMPGNAGVGNIGIGRELPDARKPALSNFQKPICGHVQWYWRTNEITKCFNRLSRTSRLYPSQNERPARVGHFSEAHDCHLTAESCKGPLNFGFLASIFCHWTHGLLGTTQRLRSVKDQVRGNEDDEHTGSQKLLRQPQCLCDIDLPCTSRITTARLQTCDGGAQYGRPTTRRRRPLSQFLGKVQLENLRVRLVRLDHRAEHVQPMPSAQRQQSAPKQPFRSNDQNWPLHGVLR